MSNFIINDESSNHKYRTELPNIIYEIGLTPNLIGVYSALKRAAGDNGQCTKSEKTLASKLFISKNTLHVLISKLCEINPFIGKPLIVLTHRFSEYGDKDTNAITITDIWPENYAFFSRDLGGSSKFDLPRVNSDLRSAKSTQGVAQNLSKGSAKSAHKEEPIKKNQYEEEQQQGVAVFFDCLVKDKRLTDDNRIALMKKKFSEERIKLAQEYSLQVSPTKGLIQQLMWHCALKIPPALPKKNFWDCVREHFKNNKTYRSADCYIDQDGIAFQRGMTHLAVKFSEVGAREKFLKYLKQLGIDWSFDG